MRLAPAVRMNTTPRPAHDTAPRHADTPTACANASTTRSPRQDEAVALASVQALCDALAQGLRQRSPGLEHAAWLDDLSDRTIALLSSHVSRPPPEGVPADPARRALDLSLDGLLAALSRAWRDWSDRPSRRLFGLLKRPQDPHPWARAAQLDVERLCLAWQTWASPPRNLWRGLHELYRQASERQLARTAGSGGLPDVEWTYKRALLMAHADPYQLAPGEFARLQDWTRQFAASARIGPADQLQRRPGLFVIRASHDHAGHAAARQHHPVPRPDDLVLDTASLAAALVSGQTGGEDRPQARLTRHLAQRWGLPQDRRSARLGVQQVVRVRVGLAAIWARLRDDDDRQWPEAHWSVTTAGDGGFSLLHLSDPAAPIAVGEVIGLSRSGHGPLPVCVVRWVRRSLDDRRLQLGVETLSLHARAVMLHRQGQAEGGSGPALLLPEEPRINRPASLLTAIAGVESGDRLDLEERHAHLMVRAVRLVERMTRTQQFQFAPDVQSAA
jgi:hypothetical protein